MTYDVRLTSTARHDRDRVLAWYDAEAPDQTERFIDEFYAASRPRTEQLDSYPPPG